MSFVLFFCVALLLNWEGKPQLPLKEVRIFVVYSLAHQFQVTALG